MCQETPFHAPVVTELTSENLVSISQGTHLNEITEAVRLSKDIGDGGIDQITAK